MSIKDLFSKSKVAIYESAESASADLESADFLKKKVEENNTFIPFTDFSDPSQFIKFGSAELYYDNSIKRVYQQYPYDGSGKEKLEFQLSSSYLDRWLYENKYPKSTGYAILTAGGYGVSTITDGYGLSADHEYIYAAGGLHTSSAGLKTGELFKNFDSSIIYDASKNRTQNFRVNPVDGTTVEFWLKKDQFIPSSTEKEVVLDLWNGAASSSVDYGRLTIYLSASTDGLNTVRATLQNGTTGFADESLAASSFTTASVADGNWHHYAVSFLSQSSGIKTFFYVDGDLNNERTIGSAGINELSGRINAYVGALQASPSGSAAAQYAGKLSGSIDEFRFWKARRTSKQINLNWYRPVDGGANTEDNNTSLGCYFKFNEGITGTSLDSTVLDYSGRLTNGSWTGYASGARSTDSCFVSAGVLSAEPADPIIYSNHPSVVSLQNEMQTSGSEYDEVNSTLLYNKLPQFMRDEDEENQFDIKKLYQIISSYFDTIYAQTKVLPDISNKNYLSSSTKPLPFANRLLESRGFQTSELFVDTEILEFYGDNDYENKKYEDNVNDIKNLIYHNIYNNLDYIYKTKGSEKSFRNLLRCFGIDDELVKFNVYTDGGTHYFNDNFKDTSVTAKYINHNDPLYFGASVYQTSSANNSLSYISGSGAEKLEKYNAFTFEVDTIIPEKLPATDPAFFDTRFLSASIGGFHQANTTDYDWATNEIANAQIYLVRDEIESNRAKFLLTNQDGTLTLSSSYYDEIYDNERWVLAVRVKPTAYPIIGSMLTASSPTYEISFYGVNHEFGEVQNEFTVTASLDYTSGSSYLSEPKRLYVGAHRQNFTGSVLEETDVQVGSCRFWMDYLTDTDLKGHSKDITNLGVDNSTRNSTLFGDELTNVPIPRADTLALNWDFDLVTSSSAGGSFSVVDVSSGSADTIYGWIDNIVRREHEATSIGFGASKTSFVDKELVYASKKELPEISVTSDSIFIKNDLQKFFIKDDDVSDNFYSLEKSMYQIISEEMLTMFASAIEFNNLMGQAVDRYRHRYKHLDKMRQLFFQKIESDMDFDRFTEYYKWIDSAISEMMVQLYPASVRHSDSIANMVESHILERNKYQNKFPITERLSSTEGSARGVGELNYNWKFGHAPLAGTQPTAVITITNPVTIGDTLTFGDGKKDPITYSFENPITDASTQILRVATALLQRAYIHNKLEADFDVAVDPTGADPEITITNNAFAFQRERGNYTLSSSFTDADNTVSGFTGGHDDENKNCLWNKERKERLDISDRETIRQVINNRNNAEAPRLFNTDGTSYEGSTFAINRLSKPYKESISFNNSIHGGINYSEGKDRDFVYSATQIHGPVSKQYPKGIPQNVMVVGVGEGQGTDAFIDCVDVEDPNEKRKWRFSAVLGRFAQTTGSSGSISARTGMDYQYKVKSSLYWPSNVVSGTVTSGYNKQVVEKFKSGSIITNLHSDTFSPTNDIGIQGPFTEAWVGGHQSRHVDLNKYDATKTTTNKLDDQYTREEAWRLLLRECEESDPNYGAGDGAMGFVGPDYGGPYPDYTRKYAIRYRDERTKRPLNVKNIRTTTGSAVHGNFVENYEVLHTFGRKENSKGFSKSGGAPLSPFFDGLPATTQEASLIGVVPIKDSADVQATAIITIDVNPSINDTISFSDNVITPVVVSTYNTPRGVGANDIVRGGNVSDTRTNTKNKLESLYNVTIVIDGNNLVITNNNPGATGNVAITASYTDPSNGIEGFSGGITGVTSKGNLVSNFNNSNRYPAEIKDQQVVDASTFGNTVVATRFSAPGGFETMSEVFLDVASKEYSAYNAMPFRNLSVRGSGSGEAGTIRVNSHANRREGLRTLLARHTGRFGIDSQHGSVVSENYNAEASFSKINRNTRKEPVRFLSAAGIPAVKSEGSFRIRGHEYLDDLDFIKIGTNTSPYSLRPTFKVGSGTFTTGSTPLFYSGSTNAETWDNLLSTINSNPNSNYSANYSIVQYNSLTGLTFRETNTNYGSIASGSTLNDLIGSGGSLTFTAWIYVEDAWANNGQKGYFFAAKDDGQPLFPNTFFFYISTPSWPTSYMTFTSFNDAVNSSFWRWDNPFTNQIYRNEWVNLTLTFNGGATSGDAKLFINNIEQMEISHYQGGSSMRTSTDGSSKVAWFNSITASIGAGSYADQLRNVAIDEFGWFDKELSTTEVETVYNNGVPLNLTASSISNLMHYWNVSSSGDYLNTGVDFLLQDKAFNSGDISGSINESGAGNISFVEEQDESSAIFSITASIESPEYDGFEKSGGSNPVGIYIINPLTGGFSGAPEVYSNTIENKYDNFNVSRAIPATDYNYLWVTSSFGRREAFGQGTRATARINISDNPTAGDTLTFGDGVKLPTTYTFANPAPNPDQILIGATPAVTRTNVINKITSDGYNIFLADGTLFSIINLNIGALGNYLIQESFTSVNNFVQGFSNGEDGQLVYGYWPKDGILSASVDVSWRENGFDSAVNFPTGSEILGS